VDEILERPSNLEIQFVCVGYIERNLVCNIVCSSSVIRLYTFCSAYFSALLIVLSDSPCERIGKLETYLVLKEDRMLVRY
jgi:hypothetical protein